MISVYKHQKQQFAKIKFPTPVEVEEELTALSRY